jgi:uncharacterized C2H2 Zn-finger protein
MGMQYLCFKCGDSLADKLALVTHVCSCVHGDDLKAVKGKGKNRRKEGQREVEGEEGVKNYAPGQVVYPLNYNVMQLAAKQDYHLTLHEKQMFARGSWDVKENELGRSGEDTNENSSDKEGMGDGNESDDSMTVENGGFSYLKPFICPFTNCGKKYSQKSSLNAHIRSHTGDKPFVCPDCGKSFSRKPSMKRHRLAHSGEKPFNCELCTKSFSRKDVLYSHMKRAHSLQIEGVEGEYIPSSDHLN